MWFFPYGTDAPIHHLPLATAGLIFANIAVFIGILAGNPYAMEAHAPWLLTYGTGLHPDQWIASGFMHLGILHLVLNMLFLWVFGLIVEGKIGALKFLICYFSILVGEAAIEQTLMLWSSAGGGSLGASAAVYGIMAMAAIWAPANDVHIKWGFGFFYIQTAELPVAGMVVFYIGIEMLGSLIFGGSSLMHLGGVVLGTIAGLVLLKRKQVDCEGYDIFSMQEKTSPGAAKREKEKVKQFVEGVDKKRDDREQKMLADAAEQIRTYLADDNHVAAHKLHETMQHVGGGIQLPSKDLMAMVRLLHGAKRYVDSVPSMQRLIQIEPEETHPLRVTLAQICVTKLERPGYALELLAEVDIERIKDPQQQLMQKIAKKARLMRAAGVVELDL